MFLSFAYCYYIIIMHILSSGLPLWLSGKEFACSAGDLGSIPGLGRSPGGGGHGNPLQDSRLENPTDGGTWRATVHRGRQESDMTEGLIV